MGNFVESFTEVQVDDIHGDPLIEVLGDVLKELEEVGGAGPVGHETVLR